MIRFLQFFPIATFLYFSRREGWELGFQMGAVIAVLQFIALLWRRLPISRLIAGTNVFLIFGGISFYFKITLFLTALGNLMESALFISMLLVVSFSTIYSKHGAFETGDSKNIRKYSVILILAIIACIAWSLNFRGDTLMAGTIPFIFLIGARFYLGRKLLAAHSQGLSIE